MHRIFAPLLLAAFSFPTASLVVPLQAEQLRAVPTVNIAEQQLSLFKKAIWLITRESPPAEFSTAADYKDIRSAHPNDSVPVML